MTNKTVIRKALRDIGVVGIGREPSDSQAKDALSELESLCLYLCTPPMSAAWIEQDVTQDSTAEENDSIRVNSPEQVVTIQIPVSITPREREVECCGNIVVREVCSSSRAPKDRAKIRIADLYGTIDPLLYVYRADLARWVKASNMDLDGDCPFADEAGLAALLAVQIASGYAQDVPQAVALRASRGLWTAAYSSDAVPATYY